MVVTTGFTDQPKSLNLDLLLNLKRKNGLFSDLYPSISISLASFRKQEFK